MENTTDVLIRQLKAVNKKIGVDWDKIKEYKPNSIYQDGDVYALSYASQLIYEQHESLEDIYEDIWEMEDKLEEMADERETAGIWKTVGGTAMIVTGTVAIIASAGELTFRSGIVMLGKEGVSTLAGYGASNLVYDKTNNQTLGMIAGIMASMGTAKGLNMADAKLGWSNKGVKGNVVESVTGDIESGSGSVQTISNKFPNDNQAGKRFDYITENGRVHIENGVQNVDFVMDMDGNLHIGRGHSYLAGGSSVQAAGTMKVNSQGYIRLITNESGHFQPTTVQAMNYPTVFRNAGLNIDNAWIRIGEFETSMSNYVIDSNVLYNGPIKNMP